VTLQATYQTGSYPEDDFYYDAPVKVKKILKNADRTAIATKFYATLFTDSTLKNKVENTDPTYFTFDFSTDSANTGKTSDTETVLVQMTKAEGSCFLAETDSSGVPVTPSTADFPYGVEVTGADLTISCEGDGSSGKPKAVTATLTNTLNPTLIQIAAADENGTNLLGGVTMLLKNSNGRIISINSVVTYTSGTAYIDIKGLVDGETYYLSEIAAPDGYAPAEDVAFTVVRGQTQQVVLKHKTKQTTDYSITATKQVYAGEYQVLAWDNATGTNASEGRYTFYAALFQDEGRKIKCSNVQQISIAVGHFTGTTTFQNLTKGGVYYLAETNAYGEPLYDTSIRTIRYEADGKVEVSSRNNSAIVQNIFSGLPKGYLYTATLTVQKQVTDSSGNPEAVTDTFYAGIYKSFDYSDTDPTILKLDLSDTSSASVKRTVLLSNQDRTYYFAELDSSGKRVTETSEYQASIDHPELTITKGSNSTVTITNKEKAITEIELTITKKVYEGSVLKKVTDTFYVNLFKDSDFTKPYFSKPFAIKLDNQSGKSLKMTLRKPNADANIYVAEVDADGNVIRNEETFGYNIRLMNSSSGAKMYTMIINSVYGTTSTNDWDQIFDDNNYSDWDYVSDNGTVPDGVSSVQTGDATPIGLYLLLMLSAALVMMQSLWRRKREMNRR
jgi:hypothetical protein